MRLSDYSGRQNLQQGATMLEIMLVLSVVGLLFVMGIKMYEQFQITLALQRLQYNVDQLFEAAANYYQYVCNPNTASQQTGTAEFYPSTLNGTPLSTPRAIPISGLIAAGFMENWQPYVSMVNPAGGESGYVVQINPNFSSTPSTTPIPVNTCVVVTPGTACVPITANNVSTPTKAYSAAPSAQIPATQAQMTPYVIQVAVNITPKSKIGGYKAVLGATCISGMNNGVVDPCPSANANKDYLVWTRSPSAISIKKGPIFSSFGPMLKEFKLQYTHDQNYELNSGYSTATSPSQAPVYYVCGG